MDGRWNLQDISLRNNFKKFQFLLLLRAFTSASNEKRWKSQSSHDFGIAIRLLSSRFVVGFVVFWPWTGYWCQSSSNRVLHVSIELLLPVVLRRLLWSEQNILPIWSIHWHVQAEIFEWWVQWSEQLLLLCARLWLCSVVVVGIVAILQLLLLPVWDELMMLLREEKKCKFFGTLFCILNKLRSPKLVVVIDNHAINLKWLPPFW